MTTTLLERPGTAVDGDRPLRGLTIRQPWAWAIAYAGKRCENRTRSLGPYRGPVAIHTSLTRATSDDLRDWRIAPAIEHHPSRWRFEVLGAVVAIADLVDVHSREALDPQLPAPACCHPWGEPGAVHHVLANVHVLREPVPFRGALGLWTVPPALADRIRTADTDSAADLTYPDRG